MIKLFHIPEHVIHTSQFSNLLSDKIVGEFERRFADYVGAKYAVSLHSATAGIELALHDEYLTELTIPSIIPPVVASAIHNAGCWVKFEDNISWVGKDYVLHAWSDCKLIDSAQRVSAGQFEKEAKPNDLMLFSFFPTKPVGSCDGGMIVSNDEDAIEQIRLLANNGMKGAGPSWEKELVEPGRKAYMNSIAAWIANENLKKLDAKNESLGVLRSYYNHEFGLNNDSNHLYRIPVADNTDFVKKAYAAGIECGIHYRALHETWTNSDNSEEEQSLPESEIAARTMVSIPFHEKLSDVEILAVVGFIKNNR